MNFENDEAVFKKKLWVLAAQKIVRSVGKKYEGDDQKKEAAGHRINSEYIRLLYDNGFQLNICLPKSKNKKGKAPVQPTS